MGIKLVIRRNCTITFLQCGIFLVINVPLFLTPGHPLWGLVMFRQDLQIAICVHSHPTGKLQSHHLELLLFSPYLLSPKPKSCGSAEVDVASKLLRWTLAHLIGGQGGEGKERGFTSRCGRWRTLLCLHGGSLIGAIHGLKSACGWTPEPHSRFQTAQKIYLE